MVTLSIVGLCGLISMTFGTVLVPITVQVTLGNLTPFFASVMAYLAIGESMSVLEITGMFVSFGGVALIAVAQS